MTILQTEFGKMQRIPPVEDSAGSVMEQRVTFNITSNMTASDIIEMFVLPAFAKVVDCILDTDALGGVTATVGLMSGTTGSTDASRTCGNELYSAAATGAVVRPSLRSAFSISPVDYDRSIGVKFSGAITAANQVVALTVLYRQ